MYAAALAAALVATVPPPAHARGAGRRGAHAGKAKAAPHAVKKAAPRSRAIPNPDGKVVLLPLRDDDDHSFTAQVERLLRARGVDVVTDVRGVDTPEQFRELATHLGIAAFVEGNLKEKEGNAISKVTVQVRSGYTGRRLTAVTFRETQASPARGDGRQAVDEGGAGDRARLRGRQQATQARSRSDGDPGRIPLNVPDPPPPPPKPKRAPATTAASRIRGAQRPRAGTASSSRAAAAPRFGADVPAPSRLLTPDALELERRAGAGGPRPCASAERQPSGGYLGPGAAPCAAR